MSWFFSPLLMSSLHVMGLQSDRQLGDGSDTSGISRIQHNNVDGNQLRQWHKGQGKWVERKEERQGESCSLIKIQPEERCCLQLNQTDLQAQYRPVSIRLWLFPSSPMFWYVSVVLRVSCRVLLWWRGRGPVCIRDYRPATFFYFIKTVFSISNLGMGIGNQYR